MEISYNLPHVFHPNSDKADNAEALAILLECLVQLNMAFLKAHPGVPPLYRSGVRYGRTTLWEPIPALYARRIGDCKSLTAARVAELRLQGIQAEPSFRYNYRSDGSGAFDYHILVLLPNGTFEDPSKALGMGQDENRWFRRG
jgi:hypothetical protein